MINAASMLSSLTIPNISYLGYLADKYGKQCESSAVETIQSTTLTKIYSIINNMGILEHLEAYLELEDFIDLSEDIDKVVD